MALTLLALGGSLTTRVLYQATLEMESAELGLRATLFMAELQAGASADHERTAGPGRLIRDDSSTDGSLRVRFDPPESLTEATHPFRTRGGFRRPRTWALGEDGFDG